MITLTRIEHFSAAHRLNSEALSAQENAQIYGKCNNLNGHGHNYRLEVSVTGPIADKTGMVVDLKWLKELIEDRVLRVFDHTHLDLDHQSLFQQRPSTTENFLMVIWEQLKEAALPTNVKISKLVLAETDKNIFSFQPPQ